MQPTIRLATEQDIPGLTTLIRKAFAEYEGKLDPPSSAKHESEQRVKAELNEGGALVYEQAGEIVGCVFYNLYEEHIYLRRLSVAPEHRRQGIASALLEAGEEFGRSQKLPEARLSVRIVLKDNIDFYQRRGYRHFSYGTHAGYKQPTFVTLSKHLS